MTMLYRFRYLFSLCASTILSVGAAQAQLVPHVNFKSGSKHYQQRTAQFERQMPVDSSMVVMLGDSHTEGGGAWNLPRPCLGHRGATLPGAAGTAQGGVPALRG